MDGYAFSANGLVSVEEDVGTQSQYCIVRQASPSLPLDEEDMEEDGDNLAASDDDAETAMRKAAAAAQPPRASAGPGRWDTVASDALTPRIACMHFWIDLDLPVNGTSCHVMPCHACGEEQAIMGFQLQCPVAGAYMRQGMCLDGRCAV